MKPLKKLNLNRETLSTLSMGEGQNAFGGLPRYFSELRGCSMGGGLCTQNCPRSEGSGCCPPPF
jgi:hypothetical protein